MRMGRWYLTKQIDGTHIRQNNNKTEKLWKHATPQQQTERKKLFVSGFFCFMFGFLTNWLDSNSEDVQQIWTWTQRRKTRNLHVAMLQFNMIEPWSMDNSIRNRLETWILVTMVVRCASFQFFMGHYFCFSCVFFVCFCLFRFGLCPALHIHSTLFHQWIQINLTWCILNHIHKAINQHLLNQITRSFRVHMHM